jgi:antitoxin component of MazEF toxin-antitoxin module
MFVPKKTALQRRMDSLWAKQDAEVQVKVKREEELLSVKVSRAEVDDLMKKMGITDSDKASRILRQVGGKVHDAVRFCVFDFPELPLKA